MELSVLDFGFAGPHKVDMVVMKAENGHEISITNYGGIVHSWLAPDRHGLPEDILLGCRDLLGYMQRHPYFGAIVGRYANRISYGRFSLEGVEYQLTANLPPHHLHGGDSGLDRKIWQYEARLENGRGVLTLRTESPHMEEGFPGNLIVTVQYTMDEEGRLTIDYTAESDRPTHINLTNHCYFNLSGGSSKTVLDHQVKIKADHVTESDDSLIPTGRLMPVAGTPLDLNHAVSLGEAIHSGADCFRAAHGFDHNYVLSAHEPGTPVAFAYHPSSGRRLRVYTDQPAVQLYTGNWLNGVDSRHGPCQDYAGFCLETHHFPDSPNHPAFPSTLLRPGVLFRSTTTYRIDVADGI